MANAFNQDERVMWEDLCQEYQDQETLAQHVDKLEGESELLARTGNQIWLPRPYIFRTTTGLDQTGNEADVTQLAVPATLSDPESVVWKLNSREMRDPNRKKDTVRSAIQALGSWINRQILTTAVYEGTLVVSQSGAPAGYDDAALCDALMTEQGVPPADRYLALNARDYNSMAGDLANKATMTGKPTSAYERNYLGNVAGFETYKLDTFLSLTAAAGTSVTINGAGQYHVPLATSGGSNYDNREQQVAITVGGGLVAVGDAFETANVFAVHQIAKQSTGQLKSSRITEIVTGGGGTGNIKVSPPFISNGGATDAEAQYQNVDSTPANGAALTFLNTVTKPVNVFWHKSAMKILPDVLAIPIDEGAAVMEFTSKAGVRLVLSKSFNNVASASTLRLDCSIGTVMLDPEMAGILLFYQT